MYEVIGDACGRCWKYDFACKRGCKYILNTKDVTNEVVAGLRKTRNNLLREADKLEQSLGRRLRNVHDALKTAMKTAEALVATKI